MIWPHVVVLALSHSPIQARAPVTTPLADAVLAQIDTADEQGISMGAVVDALESKGYAPTDVEQELWGLLTKRRLTPSGFVCRSLRKKGTKNRTERTYEFLLVRWSPELDGQLELNLSESAP